MKRSKSSSDSSFCDKYNLKDLFVVDEETILKTELMMTKTKIWTKNKSNLKMEKKKKKLEDNWNCHIIGNKFYHYSDILQNFVRKYFSKSILMLTKEEFEHLLTEFLKNSSSSSSESKDCSDKLNQLMGLNKAVDKICSIYEICQKFLKFVIISNNNVEDLDMSMYNNLDPSLEEAIVILHSLL